MCAMICIKKILKFKISESDRNGERACPTRRKRVREPGVDAGSAVDCASPTTFIHLAAQFIHPRAVDVAAGVAAPQRSPALFLGPLSCLSKKHVRFHSYSPGNKNNKTSWFSKEK